MPISSQIITIGLERHGGTMAMLQSFIVYLVLKQMLKHAPDPRLRPVHHHHPHGDDR